MTRVSYFKDCQLIACLDAIEEGLMISDVSGKILCFNAAYRRLTKLGEHLKSGDLIGKFWENGFIESEPTCLEAARKRQKVIRQHAQDSNGVFIVSQSEPILSKDQQTVDYIVTEVRDVTAFFEIRDDIENVRLAMERLARYKDPLDHYGPGIVAASPKMQKILDTAIQIAKFDISVILTGESGAGKDVVARFIHQRSRRCDGPLIAVNCAAIPEALLETELFGYGEGTFTGQLKKGKKGLFEAARGGTLFLDEIGDMPMNLQAKLLRVLESGVFSPVGSRATVETDVRIIVATNRNLRRNIKKGIFREDLYFRLAGIELAIPPLRERPEDILPLAMLFMDQFNEKYHLRKSVSPVALKRLQAYDWPGNVRELRNTIEKMMVISAGDQIVVPPDLGRGERESAEALSPQGGKSLMNPEMAIPLPASFDSLRQYMDSVEKSLLLKVCRQYRTTREMAGILKIDHSTVIRKLKKHGISAPKRGV